MFKLFGMQPSGLKLLEDGINEWAENLPKGSKVRRTQLAACSEFVVVLINVELPDDVIELKPAKPISE